MELDPGKAKKVFVRAPNWLGDVIMATPAFARIRGFFVEAEIVGGIKQGHVPILGGTDFFDRYLQTDRSRGIGAAFRGLGLLRRERFDLAILFPNSLSSALHAALAGVPVRFGYSNGRSLLMTHGVRARWVARKDRKRSGPRREPIPMVDYYHYLLDAVGMPRAANKPILRVEPAEDERARRWLARLGVDPEDRFIVLNPGASYGSSKLWEPSRWSRLAEELSGSSLGARHQLLLIVGPGEEPLGRKILDAAGVSLPAAIDPVFPLDVLKAVLRRASLMVTTDSGPRHVAVAFDVPHVVLMGPTHQGYTGRNLEHAKVIQHEVDCGPCHLKTCPLDHRCMRLIRVEEVLEACLGMVGSSRGGGAAGIPSMRAGP
ncbi:MAG: glycosyltransferase family 9 protein [Planctomycetota bacterium]